MSDFNKGDTVRVSFEAPWYLDPEDIGAKNAITLGFDQDGTLIGLVDYEAIPGTIKVELVKRAAVGA